MQKMNIDNRDYFTHGEPGLNGMSRAIVPVVPHKAVAEVSRRGKL